MLAIGYGLATGLLVVFTSISTAYAHLYSGNKWGNAFVTWGVGSGVPNSTWSSQMRVAADTWTNAPGSFTLSQTSPSVANGVFGAKSFASDPNIPDGIPGITMAYITSGRIFSASSNLNTDLSWSTNSTSFPDVRTVTLHEFGHWIRFIDSCSAAESVMCAAGQVRITL